MGGPWEDFAPAPQPSEQGPWQDYAQAAPPEPNMGYMKQLVKQNLEEATKPASAEGQPKEIKSFGEAFMAGMGMSTAGLAVTGKMPDKILPEHADMATRILYQAGTTVGDIPAMVAGAIGGSELGPIGSGAGAFAFPAALRAAYIDHIQKGDIKDFGDFWSRAAAIGWEGAKGAVTGAATAVSGGASEALLSSAPAVLQTVGPIAAQLATMTTVGKALEGQVPTAQDFIDGAVVMAGFHAVSAAAPHLEAKLQDIYAKTGLKPADVVLEAKKDPVLAQQILSNSPEFPRALDAVNASPERTRPAEIPSALNEKAPVLGEGMGEDLPRKVILSKIGEAPEPQTDRFDSWYSRTIDRLDPIARLTKAIAGGEALPKAEDPYSLFGKAQSQGFARAHLAINKAPVDFETGQKIEGARSLKAIMSDHADDPEGFKTYMLAKRTLEVSDRGIETVIPREAAEDYVNEHGAKYQKSFKEVVEWQNRFLDNLGKAEILTDKQIKEIKANNKSYVPLNTYKEGEGGKSRYSLNPIKALKGNEEYKLVDPIESMIKNAYAYSRLAEENVARTSLVELAEKNEAPESLIKKIPTPTKAVESSGDELGKYLAENYGIHDVDAESLTIWRGNAQPLADNEFAIMRDGKREVYRVDESVAKAFKAMGETVPPAGFLKVANGIGKAQRIGITLDPFFLLKHGIRDQFSATIYSNNGYRFAWDGLRGLREIFKDSAKWDEFLANGGGMTTLADFHENYIKNDIWGLSKETGLLDKVQNVVKTPLERMEMIAQMVFNAPKMGEYMRALEKGKDMATAIDDARNVTPNVQRMGSAAWVKAWSAATPFASMRMRGMDQMYRSFKESPERTAFKMATAITLPSVLTWWLHKDDERYQNAPRWEKDLFWLVPTGSSKDGVVYRVPKPFEPGVLFGSLAERTLQEYYEKDPHAFKGFGEALIGDALPQVMPAALLPVAEQWANRSWLTGGNVVPSNLEHVAPESAHAPYTSETAKILGKMVGYMPGIRDIGVGNRTIANPVIIDNYIRAWTGTLGQYAVGVLDKALETAGVVKVPPRPASTLADIPFIKSFVVRYPAAGVQPIQDFYDNLQKTETTMGTGKFLEKSDPAAWAEFMRKPETRESFVNLQGAAKALAAQNHMIQSIYSDPNMSRNDKRQLIDGIYFQMIELTKQSNALLDDLHKQARSVK